MTYRAYIRWGQGERVTDKTVTRSPVVAEAAFRELLGRTDLVGQKAAVVLSLDNRQLEYCRFDYGPEWAQGLKRQDAPIRLFHDSPELP